MYTVSDKVAERIADLRGSRDAHIDLLRQILQADDGKCFGVDRVVEAVIQRSLSLIKGFTVMVEQSNCLCAGAILRLQIDSVLRLYACWLVGDPHSLAEPLLNGEPLSRYKSRTGERLTDAYLRAEVSKLYPWIDRVYKATSGFIHLSRPHMFSTVTKVRDREVIFKIGEEGREWSDEEATEALDAFLKATKCLFHLSASWLATKQKVAAERNAESQG